MAIALAKLKVLVTWITSRTMAFNSPAPNWATAAGIPLPAINCAAADAIAAGKLEPVSSRALSCTLVTVAAGARTVGVTAGAGAGVGAGATVGAAVGKVGPVAPPPPATAAVPPPED